MVQTALIKGIDQGALNMGLAHEFVECARPPLAGQNLIAHEAVYPSAGCLTSRCSQREASAKMHNKDDAITNAILAAAPQPANRQQQTE
ncbi:Putative uncharacterized protein [Halomonas sp. R57-5]|nr:Putative uncharacterized protein [Halomonas sp. R57-5]